MRVRAQAEALFRSYGLQSGGAGRRHREHKLRLRVPLVCGANGWPAERQKCFARWQGLQLRGSEVQLQTRGEQFASPQIYTAVVANVRNGKLPSLAAGRASVGRDILISAVLLPPSPGKVLLVRLALGHWQQRLCLRIRRNPKLRPC